MQRRVQALSRLRRLGAAWLLGTGVTAGAMAQQAVPNEDGAAALACLVKPAEPLAYPDKDRERGTEGGVRIKLAFADPALAPTVEVLYRAASNDMLDQVLMHARGYRLPCLPRGRTVEAVQEFSFAAQGGQPVRWTGLRNAPRRPSADLSACLRTPEAAPTLFGHMQTGSNIKRREFGNMILALRFERADAAPSVKVLYEQADNAMRQAVMAHVAQYRVPCLPAGAEPYVMEQQFSYDGSNAQYRLNDMKLVPFLGRVKDLEKRPVRFDLDTMSCPFQVVWRLGMPAMANRVGEVGETNPNRVEFLAWLAELTMNLPSDQFERVLGQSMVLTVPCGKIELG